VTEYQNPSQCWTRVLVADDHPVIRDGIIELLSKETQLKVGGWADCAARVEELVLATDPHLIVLDLSLGSDDGIVLAQRLLRERPELRIVVLSMHDELLITDRLLAMGVMAYLTKDCAAEEFLGAVRSALHGKVYLTAEQSERLLSIGTNDSMNPEKVLSPRELAVLRLLAAGKSAAAIAAELLVAAKTVHSHRRNIGSKLGIKDGREMLRYAIHWARSHV